MLSDESGSQNENDSFFEKVYEITRLVPYGRVTSYGAIARYLGSGQSARMVAGSYSCNTDPTLFRPQSSQQEWLAYRQASFWQFLHHAATA